MKAKFSSTFNVTLITLIVVAVIISLWIGIALSAWMTPYPRPVTLGGPNITVYRVSINGEGNIAVENLGPPKVNWNR